MRVHLLFLISLICIGCNGRDSRQPSNKAAFAGAWQATYNLTLDECGLLPEGVFSFSDAFTIAFQDAELFVDAESGLFESAPATLRPDGSLSIAALLEGDLFGDGIFCSYSNSVSLLSLQHNASDALFVQRLSCADGYLCESHGVGKALRE